MSDFCKACGTDLFGPEYSDDLAGLTPWGSWFQGFAASVICEGCGCIQVDPFGNCVSTDCLQTGKEGHGMAWPTHEAVNDVDVMTFVASLADIKTPWAIGCGKLMINLWLRHKKALELTRSVHFPTASSKTMKARILKIKAALIEKIVPVRKRGE